MGANASTAVPLYASGQVLDAARLNLTNAGIPVFSGTATRDAAFGGSGEKVLAEGQFVYLEDTNAVQYYDGASFQAVGASSGLTLLDVTTFSASSAVNVSNKLLAATYANYLIIASYNSPASNNTLNMRFRENVTDKATGYNRGTTSLNIQSGLSSVTATDNGTTIRLGVYDTTDAKIATSTINLTLSANGANGQVTSAGMDISNETFEVMGAYNNTCTAITGFSLIPAAGTITGTVRTYGYANS